MINNDFPGARALPYGDRLPYPRSTRRTSGSSDTPRFKCPLRADRYINHQPGSSMIRSRFVRSFVLVLTTFVAISCADYSPIEPIAAPQIAAPTKAQDGLIGDLLGLVTGLLGSILRVIEFRSVAHR